VPRVKDMCAEYVKNSLIKHPQYSTSSKKGKLQVNMQKSFICFINITHEYIEKTGNNKRVSQHWYGCYNLVWSKQ